MNHKQTSPLPNPVSAMRIQFYLLLLAMLTTSYGLVGCAEGDFRPKAIGTDGEIFVIIDSTQWQNDVGEALRSTVGQYISTLPAPEHMFDLRQINLTSEETLDRIRRQKNIMFVAPLSDTTNEAKYIKQVFDDEAQQAIQEGQLAVISRQDLWRRSQQVYYITGASEEVIAQSIYERGEMITDTFNEITRLRLQANMFDRGRQRDIEQEVLDSHGFSVQAQHGYLIAVDTTNFIWLRRILSDTWRDLFIYYFDNADPSVLTPEWIYDTRDTITRTYVQGELAGWVEIDRRRPLETENINFLERYGFETRGLWHVIAEEDGNRFSMGQGGPFITYTFYDENDGRIYMIDGMVFAPGFQKREFLRQMEVIARTFRTTYEMEQSKEIASR